MRGEDLWDFIKEAIGPDGPVADEREALALLRAAIVLAEKDVARLAACGDRSEMPK